jgi:hypothetical protein
LQIACQPGALALLPLDRQRLFKPGSRLRIAAAPHGEIGQVEQGIRLPGAVAQLLCKRERLLVDRFGGGEIGAGFVLAADPPQAERNAGQNGRFGLPC